MNRILLCSPIYDASDIAFFLYYSVSFHGSNMLIVERFYCIILVLIIANNIVYKKPRPLRKVDGGKK